MEETLQLYMNDIDSIPLLSNEEELSLVKMKEERR